MRKGAVFVALALAVGALFVSDAASSQSKNQAPPVFKPFRLGKFLPIESDSGLVRLEDLKVTQGSTGMPEAVVNIKNLSEQKIQVAVHVAVFDGDLKLVAGGNYESVSLLGGFESRESSMETISLGKVRDLSRGKYYQTRVVAFVDR